MKVLIGNKCDLLSDDHSRRVPLSHAQSFALDHEMMYFEVSAKTSVNVIDSFMQMGSLINALGAINTQDMMLGFDSQIKIGGGLNVDDEDNESIQERMNKKKERKRASLSLGEGNVGRRKKKGCKC